MTVMTAMGTASAVLAGCVLLVRRMDASVRAELSAREERWSNAP